MNSSLVLNLSVSGILLKMPSCLANHKLSFNFLKHQVTFCALGLLALFLIKLQTESSHQSDVWNFIKNNTLSQLFKFCIETYST